MLTSLDMLTADEVDADDGDLFQCGKCKKQFSTLANFVGHKKECAVGGQKTVGQQLKRNSASGLSPNDFPAMSGPTVALKPSIGSSLTSHLSLPTSPTLSGVILSDSDLLSLTTSLEHNMASISTISPSGLHLTGDNSLGAVDAVGDTFSAFLSGISAAANGNSSTNQANQTLGLPVSLIGSNLLSTPFLVQTTAANGNTNTVTLPSNFVLNLTNAVPNSSDTISIITSSSSSSGAITTLATATQTQVASNVVKVTPTVSSVGSLTVTGGLAKGQDSPSKSKRQLDAAIHVLPASDLKASTHKTRRRTANKSEMASLSALSKRQAKLKCQFCDRCFNKNFDLQQHIRCHTGEKPFQCIVCGRAFAQKSNVKKHMQTHKVWPDGLAHTLPPQSNASPAELSQSDEKDISNAEEMEESDSYPEPDLPAQQHQQQQQQQQQFQQKNSIDSSYVCPYCPYNGKTYFELKSHMKTHKREKVYKCIQTSCGVMFSELEPFLEHIQTHETEMTYRCHQCNKTFSSLYELGVHQYSHSLYPNQGSRTGQRYFRCQKCLNKYTTPAALEHHLATSTHHYPCQHCNKVFPCERYLRRHLLTHGSGLHICQYCEKTFKTANYLKVHLVIHTGEKEFVCNICDAAFNRRDKLKRHKLVHDPIKRFKCPFKAHTGCPKEFNRPDKLKAHILTHSGIKPHQCGICARSFSRRAHLREHQKAHENSHTVADGQTSVATASPTPTSLSNATILNKTDFITLFDCQSCGNLFASELDLKKHACGNESSGGVSFGVKANKKVMKSNAGSKGGVSLSSSSKKNMSSKTKPKPSNVNATLTTAVLGGDSDQITPKDSSNSDNEFTFQFHDGLVDDIPTAHIEIITAPVDIGGSFSPVVTIDGIHYPAIPILTNTIANDDDGDCTHSSTGKDDQLSTKLLLTTLSSMNGKVS